VSLEPPTSTAVELPEARVRVQRAPGPPVRGRHRILTIPGGLLLFVAMFLPSVRECGETHYPLDTPILIGPYLLALAVALVASMPARMRDYAGRIFVLLSFLHYAVLAIALVVAMFTDIEAFGTLCVVLVCAFVVYIAAKPAMTIDERVAAVTFVQGMQWCFWFGLWNLFDDVLVGMRLALGSATLLTLGAALWLRDARSPSTRS
jgi:hypothetical protein